MPPSTDQRKYIYDLLERKAVPSDVLDKYGLDDLLPGYGVGSLSVAQASELIDDLLRCPTKVDGGE